MTEYAFDIVLRAVARIEANSQPEAEAELKGELVDIDLDWTGLTGARITEASLGDIVGCFEVDGFEVDRENIEAGVPLKAECVECGSEVDLDAKKCPVCAEPDPASHKPCDTYHWHEALDRSAMVQSIFDDHVLSHPVIRSHLGLSERATRITQLLAELYVAIGNASPNFKDSKPEATDA